MAVDSRDKRSSILLLALAFGRIWPHPNGAVADQDRQQMGRLYRGISAIAATLISLERSISRRVHGRVFGRVNRSERAWSAAERVN